MHAGSDRDVRTFFQSGNVILNSHLRSADGLGWAVRAVLKEEFGVDSPVLLRTPKQIRDDPKVIAAYLGTDEEEAIAVMESGT